MATPAVTFEGWSRKRTSTGAPPLIVNVLLVALVNPLDVAESVTPELAACVLRSEKVATPFTAATVVVPRSVTVLPGPDAAIVTLAVDDVIVFPDASWIATWTEPKVAPAVAVVG